MIVFSSTSVLSMSPILQSGSLIIEVWFHGLYTTLMLATLYTLVKSTSIPPKRKFWQIALVLVPYACSTIHMLFDWLLAQDAIDDNELPTGPGVLVSLVHVPAWKIGFSLSAFATNILVADFVFIWRCWVVWGRRWTIILLLPVLSMATGAVIAGITIADQSIAAEQSQSMVQAMQSRLFITFSTVFFALSISTSLMTTLLISARIIAVQRESAGGTNEGVKSLYTATVEILVESAAIYSVTLLAFIIVLSRPHSLSAQFYAQNIHAQVTGLAPLLIIYRVAAQHARPDKEWEQTRVLSSVRFVRSPSGGTGSASSIHTLEGSNSV